MSSFILPRACPKNRSINYCPLCPVIITTERDGYIYAIITAERDGYIHAIITTERDGYIHAIITAERDGYI